MDRPIDKLIKTLTTRGIRDVEFYKSYGISSQSFTNWKKRGIPHKHLDGVADYLGLDRDEFKYGDKTLEQCPDKKKGNKVDNQLHLEAAKFALEAFREFVGFTERESLGVDIELKLFDLLYRYYLLCLEAGESIEPNSSEVAKILKLNT